MLREILSSIKEIVLDYVKHRLFPVTVVILVLFSMLVRRLFVLQIVEGKEHMDNFIYKTEKTLTVDSVRGCIKDRNGKLLAYNELSYSVIYSNDANIAIMASEKGISENELKNEILYKTITILEKNGDELYVDFPIQLSSSGEYKFTVKDTALRNFLKDVYSVIDFDELTDNQKNASADDIMDFLCSSERFNVSDSYDKDYRLKIVSCRYKLWLNRYQQYVPVTIAYDISEESNAMITEYSDELIGMSVSVKSLRRYNNPKYFAHIIGYVGTISTDEMTEYNSTLDDEKKYTGTEMVGKTGIEQYCESDLRGESGFETMYVDNLGKVIETVDSKEASAGNDVYLTIDADLQKYAYDTLEKEIVSIILTYLVDQLDVPEGENANIPISEVYFGLFNNNYLSIEKMSEPDATELEKRIYNAFTSTKESTLSRIKYILDSGIPLNELSPVEQNYMEYICKILSKNDIYRRSLIDENSSEFINYTNNLTSLKDYLKYAISVEAIDISSIDVESDYYDNDEIYELLCDYAINYLNQDTEFDKLITKNMIKSGEISGYDVVNLLYIQGVLNDANDIEYQEMQSGVYGPYEFFRKKLENLDITPDMLALDPCSGSVIITDVRTGDVLAMVSYPSYDNNLLTNEVNAEYYNRLLEDKTTPLYNRACQQKTAPGSTYKPLAAITGLTEGVIDTSTYIYCNQLFDKIDPPAKCMFAHGGLNVEKAIENSCNLYFYNVGYSLEKKEDGTMSDSYGCDRFAKYSKMFGLGDKSGVELPEISPSISDNDAVRSAIGQGKHSYAPIQLSRYVTTVANSGTCYNLTLIDKVTDSQGNLIYDNQATVLNQIDEVSDTTWNSVHAGMRAVIERSAPSTDLINRINVNVAGKTGTAQESEIRPDHALFISYAPYENPEISVTCVIQNGYYSGNARELAGFIYAYMYDPDKLVDAKMNGDSSEETD